MTGVKAKFFAAGVELLPGTQGCRVRLSAVARGDRNTQWAKASPSGSMDLTINNPAAAKWWEDFMQAARRTNRQPEVFIDIYPSEDGWPGDGHAFRLAEGFSEGEWGFGKCGECGLGKDDRIMEWDPILQKQVDIGPGHP